MPPNILNLTTYIVTKLVENKYDYHIGAEAKQHPATCQNWGSPDIVGFGRNEQLVRDLTIHGKRVGIGSVKNFSLLFSQCLSVIRLLQPFGSMTPIMSGG